MGVQQPAFVSIPSVRPLLGGRLTCIRHQKQKADRSWVYTDKSHWCGSVHAPSARGPLYLYISYTPGARIRMSFGDCRGDISRAPLLPSYPPWRSTQPRSGHRGPEPARPLPGQPRETITSCLCYSLSPALSLLPSPVSVALHWVLTSHSAAYYS